MFYAGLAALLGAYTQIYPQKLWTLLVASGAVSAAAAQRVFYAGK